MIDSFGKIWSLKQVLNLSLPSYLKPNQRKIVFLFSYLEEIFQSILSSKLLMDLG